MSMAATYAAVSDAVGPIPWPQLGAGGLLAVTVGMILMGWLVPRRIADKWESAWREEQALNREQAAQLAQLTEMGHTTVALLQSITDEAAKADQDGG